MAKIGFRYPVVAKGAFDNLANGTAPTYSAGKVLGNGISANISWNSSDEHMYGDDVEVETNTSLTGGSLSVEVDDISSDVRAYIFGIEKGSNGEITVTDAVAPYVGFGFVSCKQKKNVAKYVAHWIYKVQFKHSSEDFATKADRVTFVSEKLDATILASHMNNSGANVFHTQSDDCETFEAAKAWLNEKAGIA